MVTTNAATIDITSLQDTLSIPTGFNATGLLVDGVAQGSGQQLGVTQGVEQTFRYTLDGFSHTVEIVEGPAYARGNAPSENVGSTPVLRFAVPTAASVVITSPSAPPKRLLVLGDSIWLGATLSSGCGAYVSPAMVMRSNIFASSTGTFGGARLINDSIAGGRLNDIAIDAGTITATVARIVSQMDGTVANGILITLGTNDYAAGLLAATYQTQLGNLLDAIHVALPSAKVFLYGPISRVAPATEAANGAGSTLGDFRTAMSTVQSTRSGYVSYRSGSGVVTSPTNYAADGVHPGNSAGMSQIEVDARILIGY